ncbi:MAG: hypothetical protein IJ220_03925 [Clostridia bacterium]|nr:hypothetical protein [Clostridia bacterium]
MKKGFLLGLTTGIVLTGASLVMANSQIQAILNDQIKVTLDGKVQEFKDETTSEVQYPITYHDRTYLPLRTVANLVGVDVDYDAESNTAILTSKNQTGVGNTDEGMVALVLEQHYKSNYPDVVEEVNPVNIKVYTAEEIASNELLKDYELNEGDIVFEAEYELKIVDGYEDMMQFTAGTGEVDGQWIRHKHNVGIARSGAEGYTLDAFGTAF